MRLMIRLTIPNERIKFIDIFRDNNINRVVDNERYKWRKIQVMGDKDKCWNGGATNESKERMIRQWNRMIRDSEDYFDTIDSEKEFRKDLQEREKLMKEESKHQKIQSKYSLSKKPLHELYTDIDYSEKTPITGIGGVGGPIDVMRSKSIKSKGETK